MATMQNLVLAVIVGALAGCVLGALQRWLGNAQRRMEERPAALALVCTLGLLGIVAFVIGDPPSVAAASALCVVGLGMWRGLWSL